MTMKLMTENNVEIHKSTILFLGLESRKQARETAKENRSYFFNVFNDVFDKKTKKTNRVFYGYGVPK